MDDALMPREDRPTRHSGLWPGIHSGPAAQASVLSPMHRNRLVDVVQYFDDLLTYRARGRGDLVIDVHMCCVTAYTSLRAHRIRRIRRRLSTVGVGATRQSPVSMGEHDRGEITASSAFPHWNGELPLQYGRQVPCVYASYKDR